MKVHFKNNSHPSIEIPPGTNLCEGLDITSSPVLFGCRTGVCGTCLCKIEVLQGQIDPQSETEKELLEIIASDVTKARLACQVTATEAGSIEIEYIG